MKPTIIDITTILSPDLKSRLGVKDLYTLVQNMNAESVTIDFKSVKFATRSFIDEYYNYFIKDNPLNVATINIPEDIKTIITAVQATQNKKKSTSITNSVIRCKNAKEVVQLLGSLQL